jgi:hypothetical protein
MHIYPVTDLLMSTEDRSVSSGYGSGSGTQGGSSFGQQGGTSESSFSPQFGQTRNSGFQFNTGGTQGNGETTSGNVSPLTSRAENLILLIKNSCGQGTWALPYSSGLIDTANGRLPDATQGIPVLAGP